MSNLALAPKQNESKLDEQFNSSSNGSTQANSTFTFNNISSPANNNSINKTDKKKLKSDELIKPNNSINFNNTNQTNISKNTIKKPNGYHLETDDYSANYYSQADRYKSHYETGLVKKENREAIQNENMLFYHQQQQPQYQQHLDTTKKQFANPAYEFKGFQSANQLFPNPQYDFTNQLYLNTQLNLNPKLSPIKQPKTATNPERKLCNGTFN